MWAAVIKTINNLLRRSVASSVGAPKWGQSRSQYMPRRGPCRTCLQGASRRPKPKYVHAFITNDCRLFSCSSCVRIITGVYFRRLKINHESPGFIFDPGTVANNPLYHNSLSLRNETFLISQHICGYAHCSSNQSISPPPYILYVSPKSTQIAY